MTWNWDHFITISFTLFAVIDVLGSIPILVSLKDKIGKINAAKVTLVSGLFMVGFLFLGKSFLNILGLDVKSFAIGGSIVIFLLGIEMVLGLELFKSDKDVKEGTIVPIAFPIIAGSGSLTTIMSLKANFEEQIILAAILVNLLVVFIALKSLGAVERLLGKGGMLAVRKFFGVILLAIAVKIFSTNLSSFGK
jgi:multiple antibiotic resistance protein